MRSLCPESGQVAMTDACQLVTNSFATPAYKCYSLHTVGPCIEGYVAVDLSRSTVACTANSRYAIYDSLPSRPCTPGSLRDHMDRCTVMFTGSMASGTLSLNTGNAIVSPTVKPGMYDNGMVCPDNYFYLSGSCLQFVPGI